MNLKDLKEFQIVTNCDKNWAGIRLPDGRAMGVSLKHSNTYTVDMCASFGLNGDMQIDPILTSMELHNILRLVLRVRKDKGF